MKSFTEYTNFVEAIIDLPENKGQGFVFREILLDSVEEHTLSYDDLIQQSQKLAAQLQAQFQPGDRALAMCPPSIDYVVSVVASLLAGVVLVPVYPPKKHRNNWQRLLSIISDATPRLFFTTREEYQAHLPAFEEIEAQGVSPVFVDDDKHDVDYLYTPQKIEKESLAYIQYTSGSTSAPKGLRVTHDNLLHNMEVTRQSLNLPEEKIFVSWLPFYHDMGLIGTLFQALYFSATYVFMSPFEFVKNPLVWLQAISDYRATISWAPNFAYDLCADKISSDDIKKIDLSSWQVAANMAEPVRPDTLERFFETFSPAGFAYESACPAYGMAETTLTITASPSGVKPKTLAVTIDSYKKGQIKLAEAFSDDTPSIKLASSGVVSSDQLVIIADPKTGQRLDDCNIGEIWVYGRSVTKGYFNWGGTDEKAFAGKCSQHPDKLFLKTGDLGFFYKGELYITGRKKDVVIIRGENYYPQDIELTVQSSNHLLRKGCIAAFAIEHDQQEALIVIAELVKAPLSPQDYSDITRTAKSAVLNEYGLRLRELVLLAPGSYIRTSSGKVQRSLSRKKYLANELISLAAENDSEHSTVHANGEYTDDLSTWLKSTLSELLKVPLASIDRECSFADYGLDSLTATQYAGLISKKIKRSVPLEAAYDYPNLFLLEKFLRNNTEHKQVVGNQGVYRSHSDNLPAIIGMSCRFPGAENIDQFWSMLTGAGNGLSTEGQQRWSASSAIPESCTKGGFIRDIKRFDCNFFGITPREAESMDPQQRFLLELCHQALEDAGVCRDEIQGSLTGVYVGISDADYARQQLKYAEPESYAGTGSALSIAANRLSYYWDLKGPSCAIDSACSSSLVALNTACQDLLAGDIDMAIVGAVNLLVSPDLSVIYQKANMLAPDGICKVFDDSANGYVRGEGCGVIVLKRQQDAIRDGDPIHSLIKATSVMQDGKSNGLSAPVGPAQSQLISRTIAKAGIKPDAIDYVEAHGTGTGLGDPIEVSALSSVFTKNSQRQSNILVGSVKANIGHLESAAGIAGLIKTTLCLKHKILPPQIHLDKPSNKIPWASNGITILPAHTLPWPETNAPRRAGISSFGFGGTLAHTIIEEAPTRQRPEAILPERSYELLCLSAKSEEALLALRDKYQVFLSESDLNKTDNALGDITYTATTARTHFSYRLAVQGDSPEALARALGEVEGVSEVITDPKTAWLFSGQGAQYIGMGKTLYHQEPVFRSALDHCAELLTDELDYPLLDVFWGEHSEQINETQYTQPALFSLGYSLAQLWQSWGHTPSVVMGHSVGEYVAACIAGVFDLASGLRLIAARGRLMQQETDVGAMAVVFAPASIVESALLTMAGKRVSIGAYNGPENTVVSGAIDDVDAVLDLLLDYRHYRLPVSRGFHSPLMDAMLDDFRQVANSIDYQAPSLPLVSNVSGEHEGSALCKADYWVKHVRAPVRFEQSMKVLASMGTNVYLELGPSHTLLGMGRQCGVKGRWASSLVSGEPDNNSILNALSVLYSTGIGIDWSTYYRDRGHWRISLPTYTFQGKDYWFETRSSQASVFDSSTSKGVAISPDSTVWQLSIADLLAKGLGDHQVYKIPVCPGAFYIAQALDFYSRLYTINTKDKKIIAEGIVFKQALTLEDEQATVQFRLDKKAGFVACTVFSIQGDEWVELCQIEKIHYASAESRHKSFEKNDNSGHNIDVSTVYKRLGEAGLNLAGQYENLYDLSIDGSYIQARTNNDSSFAINTPSRWHLLIDNLLQTAVFHKLHSNGRVVDNQLPSLFVPFAIDRCELDLQLFDKNNYSNFHYAGRANQEGSAAQQHFDLQLNTENEESIIQLSDVIINKLPTSLPLKRKPSRALQTGFSIQWNERKELNNSKDKKGLCLLFSSVNAPVSILSELKGTFSEVLCIHPSTQFSQEGEEVTLDIQNQEHWRKLINFVSKRSQVLSSIVVFPDIASVERQNSHDVFLPLFTLIQGLNYFSVLVDNNVEKTTEKILDKRVPLVFITQASLACDNASDIIYPEQAAVSALVQSLNNEYTWCRAIQIDLPMVLSPLNKQQVASLVTSLAWPASVKNINSASGFIDTNFALRGNKVLEPSLQPSQYPHTDMPELVSDRVYLVTGGLGELGLLAAKWLVERGARKIVLLQRSNKVDKQHKAIAELEQQGANITVLSCDMTDREQLNTKLTQLQADQGGINGVIHAAGSLKDSLIINARWDEFQQPLHTKITGTLNLLHCLRKQALDFCLLYSSITSLIGPPGQTNYSMANSFLNALPYLAPYQKLNITSIIWGPWKNLGMARDDVVVERFRDSFGVLPVTVNRAFSILDDAVNRPSEPVRIAAEFDRDFSPSATSLPTLFSAVFNENTVAPNGRIDNAEAITTLEELTLRIREMIVKAMKLDASYSLKDNQTLQELGMDSVMALELQAMLGTLVSARLPATLFFDYPTINEVSQFMFTQYFTKNESDTEQKSDVSTSETVDDEQVEEAWDQSSLEQLTTDELAQVLASELSDLDALESES